SVRSSPSKREGASRKGRDRRPAKPAAPAVPSAQCPVPSGTKAGRPAAAGPGTGDRAPGTVPTAPGQRRTILALASAAALLLATGLGSYLHRAGRKSNADVPTPATWALPESEAERGLLSSGNGRGAPEALGRYYLEAGRPFAAVWQFQDA